MRPPRWLFFVAWGRASVGAVSTRGRHVKSNWSAFIGACTVCTILGFAVGQRVGTRGSVAAPIKQAQAVNNAPAVPGSDQIFKVALGDPPQKRDPPPNLTILHRSASHCPFS